MKHNEGFLHVVADAKTRVQEIDLATYQALRACMRTFQRANG